MNEVRGHIISLIWERDIKYLIDKKQRLGDGFDLNKALDENIDKAMASYKLIEPGCGDARAAFVGNVMYGWEAIAIDADPVMTKLSQANIDALAKEQLIDGSGIQVIQGDFLGEDTLNTLFPASQNDPAKNNIFYLYLTRPNVARAVETFMPYMRQGDLVVTNKVPLGNIKKRLGFDNLVTKTEIPAYMGEQFNIYQVK